MNVTQISIDGATGTGKTTLGMSLASGLAGAFLDTGYTYRAVTACLIRGQSLDDIAKGSWRDWIRHQPARFDATGAPVEKVFLNGQDITDEIWTPEVDNSLDIVARNPRIRASILDYHAKIVGDLDLPLFVAGRDVGVTLLKEALLHILLTANFTVRRERRRAQYREFPGRSVAVGSVSKLDLETRELLTRSPLTLEIDTSHLPSIAVYNIVSNELDRLIK